MRIAESVLDLLEFHKSLFPFAENLRGEPGARALASLALCRSLEELEKRHDLLKSWMDCSDRYGDRQFPWNADVVCVSELFPSARKSGILLGDELLKIRVLLRLATDVRGALAGLKAEYPAFELPERRIRDFTAELEALSVIEDSGRLADNASPKLQEIRGELEALKRAGRKTASRLMEDPNILNMLQERSPAWRDGRFLLLVRQEYINRFPGLLVDRSSSGNSVYMEPRMLSSVNNRMVLQARDEHDEETRILMEITGKMIARERAITEAESVLGEIDLLYATHEVMKKRRWTLPELTRKTQISLVGARHPLLKEAAVPVDVRCGGGFTSLVITGPNTGGKTVVLKTTGLCAAMAWAGLPLPARDGSVVGNFDALYADIGDEQSIEQNLSTFSAHLKNIVAILKTADRRSLVLLDELGAGTDPHEGAALGIAILDTLKDNHVLTLATTHHNPIKQYALTTPSIETASMEFDIEKLAPTYRLLMGVPGQSNALLIARRWGMPEAVLERARSSLRERDVSAEDLMGELNERRVFLDREERRLEAERAEMARLKKFYEERVAEIDYQKDKIIEAADRRASDFVSRAEATSRDLIKSLEAAAKSAAQREFNDRRRDLQTIRKGVDSRHAKRVEKELVGRPESFVPKEGVTVQVAGSPIVGVIESVKNGKASLVAGAMRLEVPVDQLLQTQKKAKVAAPPVDTSSIIIKHESVPSSLMIRGMGVDEALPLAGTYLDRAYRAGYTSVVVIHGRGEGVLRREVHALCARLKYVADYRLGEVSEGGYGVTVVSFRR
ncbi:MAG: Smr/MutS family protein [Synergistaceae bacterium]|jgi:DNA mismatch repair protein MutS2|nr:Smr/MutS family protein [Synergistaceae bacterium]